MTGYIRDLSGRRSQLPCFLGWDIRRTDGEPCDSFSVSFACSDSLLELLPQALLFEADHGGERVFTGVVDEFTAKLSPEGFIGELTGRGMAALLMDTQVQGSDFFCAQIDDILEQYVLPCGVYVEARQTMPPVPLFTVETGNSCWQALTGFCRHSADIFPFFDAQGGLILKKDTTGKKITISTGVEQVRYCAQRYGRIAKQILVNTRNGQKLTAMDAQFCAMGGRSVRISGMSGQKTRAVWRNAEQRIEDARRSTGGLEVTLQGAFAAEPNDIAELALDEFGVRGKFRVSEVYSRFCREGTQCILSLR